MKSSSSSFYVNLSTLKRGLDVTNNNFLLHKDLSCASFSFNPHLSMSLFTHCIHVFLLLPFLLYSTYHLQLSALRYPIISLLTFHMSKPSQPTTPNNSIHTLNTQLKPDFLTRSSVLQGHSRHPPNHGIFRSHKPLHIIHFHRPSFATIHKHPLYTHSIYLSLHFQ